MAQGQSCRCFRPRRMRVCVPCATPAQGVSSHAPTAQPSLTERQVLEPLQGFFQYGMVRLTPGVSKVGLGKQVVA